MPRGFYIPVNKDETGAEIIRNTGTGYRISLVIAMVLCIIAMAIILFYDEKKVMDVIEKSHEEKES